MRNDPELNKFMYMGMKLAWIEYNKSELDLELGQNTEISYSMFKYTPITHPFIADERLGLNSQGRKELQ